MPAKTKLESCIARALDLIETDPLTNLSADRKANLWFDIKTLADWAQNNLTPQLQWHTSDSKLRGHSLYYDDPRGPNDSRFVITPIATKSGRFSRYDIGADSGSSIGSAKTIDDAKAIAQQYADKYPPED